jgi:hypothetical protein
VKRAQREPVPDLIVRGGPRYQQMVNGGESCAASSDRFHTSARCWCLKCGNRSARGPVAAR